MKQTPSRVSPFTYPIAATATAHAYDFFPEEQVEQAQSPEVSAQPTQQPLFSGPVPDSRVIPFDSLTSEAVRQSIYARFAGVNRPAPLSAEKVEVLRPRTKQARYETQRHLDLFGTDELLTPPQSSIICDAPVAPALLRAKAGLVDLGIMSAGCALSAIVSRFCCGSGLILDKHLLPFVLAALVTIPILYRLLWAFAGLDSLGMRITGLRLVDFDGNPPSQSRRYYRIAGSLISVLAAGMGIIWTFVDQDNLSWHDHISNTFPTVSSDQ